jgi:glutamine synthetase
MDRDEITRWLDEHDIDTVRTEGVNLDGVVIGKYVSRSKFERALTSGVALSDINAFACDISGSPQFGWWAEWRPSFFGDILQRPDPATLVIQPGTPGLAACVVDHTDVEGRALPVCSRTIVRQLVDQIGELGYEVRMSAELEAVAFEESFAEARAKGYRALTPLAGGDPRPAYSITVAHEMDTLLGEARRRLTAMGIPWEVMNKEFASGQFEINLEPADPVTFADRQIRLKQVLREVALEQGHSVTFMPTPRGGVLPEVYGSGLHLHHSLWRGGEPAFYDASAPGNRSTTMLHWLGGLLATMRGSMLLLAPTMNSYRRLAGFGGGPHAVTWCDENKTTAIRTISRAPSLARIEHRVACADANPYLLAAAVLAGGLAGLEEQIEPPDEFRYIAWQVPERIPQLPRSMVESAEAMEGDERLTKKLGTEFVDYWLHTRRWEWLMFHSGGADPQAIEPTDWELHRYFETV